MKKILSAILSAVMILTLMSSLTVFVSADGEEEGMWDVMLAADTDRVEPEKNPPIPGYFYDESGFHTKSPEYKNFNPKFTVISKGKYNIENFSMTVVLHDYCVSGDNWVSFTLWSECNGIANGDTSGKYGDGWTSVIRAKEDGILNRLESWNQTKTRSGVQVYTPIDNTQSNPLKFEPCVDEATGDITITFEIVDKVVSVNGMILGTATDAVIKNRFKDGFAHVGITVHNTDSSGDYHPSVSILEVNGEKPVGSDSREPEAKVRVIGDMIDSSTVAPNTPAIWFDATLEKTNNSMPKDTRFCNVTFSDDNMNYKVTAENEVFYLQMDVPDAITYNAADFPYFMVIFKNYCTCSLSADQRPNEYCTGNGEVSLLRYCAGNVTSPNDICVKDLDIFYNVTPIGEDACVATDDYYSAVIIPIEDEQWQGRVHALRLDFGNFVHFGVEGRNGFEIMFAGLFKTGNDAAGFLRDFRGLNLDTIIVELDYPIDGRDCSIEGCVDNNEDGSCDFCGNEVESGSSGNTNDPTTGDDEKTTTEEETTAAKKPADTSNVTDNGGDKADKKGCGSVVSLGAISIASIIGFGMVIKKKED